MLEVACRRAASVLNDKVHVEVHAMFIRSSGNLTLSL